MQTRKQLYAVAVYRRVADVRKQFKDQDEINKYGGLAHRLPILVRRAGLAQALGFVEARGKAPGKQLLADLAAVVGHKTPESLLERSRAADLAEYTLLTRRVLEALEWFGRYAQSVLGVEKGADQKEDAG